jgi:hypothetical protein
MNGKQTVLAATLMLTGTTIAMADEATPAWQLEGFILEEIVVFGDAPTSFYLEEIVVTVEAPAHFYLEEFVAVAKPPVILYEKKYVAAVLDEL